MRTVLQHAWAEFEHDIRYKGTVPEEHARDFDRRFTLAAGLLELADQEFTTIRDRLRGGSVAEPEIDADGITPRELAAYLAGQYPDAEWSRTDHYAWIAEPAARARHHHAGRARRGARRRRRRRRSPRGWTTATRPAPYAASTTPCSRRSASGTSTCPATRTARRCCATRLERMRGVRSS